MEKHYEIKKTINKIIREKKRFPSLQEMCNILHYTEDQTKKYMQVLAEDGYLEKVEDWYRFPEKEDNPLINKNIVVDKEMREPIEIYKNGQTVTMAESRGAVDPVQGNTEGSNPSLPKENVIRIHEYEPAVLALPSEKQHARTYSDEDSIIKKLKNLLKSRNKKTKKQLSKYSAPIYIIQILMGAIGIGASIISIYYTTVWLLEFLPWAFALLLSAIMVGFAVSAFETVILFLSGQVTRSKVAQWSITLGFIILWAAVTFFSIFSTVAGQYNKFVLNLKDQARQGIDTGKMNWESLQEQKRDLRSRLNEYKENSKTYTEISKTMRGLDKRTENDKTWAENQWSLNKTNKEIKAVLDELNKIREEERILLKESKDKGIILGVTKDTENIVNFYGWLAKVLGIDKDKAQFFMSLLPACFVDLIGPVSIAISLFLRNKYK
jgi:hypothetical protein